MTPGSRNSAIGDFRREDALRPYQTFGFHGRNQIDNLRRTTASKSRENRTRACFRGIHWIGTRPTYFRGRNVSMPIEYQETSKDLLKRIDIHKKYGGRDIDAWSLELLKPLSTESIPKILDIGCGAGKQCFLYHDVCEGKADVTGGDVSAELLARAEAENQRRNSQITFMNVNFDARLPFDSNQFDLVSSSFALYYASDFDFTINEIHRVIKPGGRMFCTGPLPGNKQLFYDVIAEASQKPIPPMPGSPRYESGVVAAMRRVFASVNLHIFENPLTFTEVGPFLEYTRASLSEDRKIWKSLFAGPTEFEALMQSIEGVAKKRLANDGKLVMTKVVGGALAVKANPQSTERRTK